MLKFDFDTYNEKFITKSDLSSYKDRIKKIKSEFIDGELSQWLTTKTYVSDKELKDIKATAKHIREICDVFVVIGIGGSYMGAKAVISALEKKSKPRKVEILFFGNSMNAMDYRETLDYIKNKDICVNVISKSGTTLEPSLAFDAIMELMEKKYSDAELKERVYITTDANKGTLRELVNEKGYKSFIVPDNVGGRFSVLTPVGLLPIAVAGYKIDELLFGAEEAIKNELEDAIKYAAIRDIMDNKGKSIESFTIYNERLYYFTEWLKQLFAESHGKEGKGIFPISSVNSRDLHSMGQFFQEGKNIIFETVIGVNDEDDFFVGKYNLNRLNDIAVTSVAQAHKNGYTPSSIIWINRLDEKYLGELIEFFFISTIAGGRLLGINPFDQPGVEEYKKQIKSNL